MFGWGCRCPATSDGVRWSHLRIARPVRQAVRTWPGLPTGRAARRCGIFCTAGAPGKGLCGLCPLNRTYKQHASQFLNDSCFLPKRPAGSSFTPAHQSARARPAPAHSWAVTAQSPAHCPPCVNCGLCTYDGDCPPQGVVLPVLTARVGAAARLTAVLSMRASMLICALISIGAL